MTSDPTSGGESAEEENGTQKCLSGFIFMCNQRTKVECYQYRVFGLPYGQRQVLGEIKTGAKLFLYDFESKLLYGIYEATSDGTLDIEPAAFGGKFPAQVGFRIFEECLPMPESNLREIIKENYTGWKFKQELSGKQVEALSSSFQPLTTSQHAHQATPSVSQYHLMPPLARKAQFKHTSRLPHSTGRQHGRTSQYQAATVPDMYYPMQGYGKTKYEMALIDQLSHHSFQRNGGYEATNSRQSHLPSGYPGQVQEPYSRTMIQRTPHDQVTNIGQQYQQLPEDMQAHCRDDVIRYSSYQQPATAQYPPSAMQSDLAQYASPVLQLSPDQYMSSNVQPGLAQNAPSIMQPDSAQYASSATQHDARYYSSYDAASAQYNPSITEPDSAYCTSPVIQPALAQYASSVVQPVLAQYASSAMQPSSAHYMSTVTQPDSGYYTSSVMQPGSYHSYSGAT